MPVEILLGVDVMVKSPAYDVGDRAEPCGTRLGKFLVCEDLPLNDTCACLPPK